ncbi:O-antigen ligase family protein [Paenibacillus sp. CMAA1364]
MSIALLLLSLPLLICGLMMVIHVFERSYIQYITIGLVIVTMISGIRFNIGYLNIYIDLPFVILLVINATLLIHIFLRSRINPLEIPIHLKSKLNIITVIISGVICILMFQCYMVELYDISLYVYHVNISINLLLLTLMFYLLSLIEFKKEPFLIGIAVYSLVNSILGILQFIFNKSFLPFAAEESINYYEGVVVTKRVMGFVGASNGAGNLGTILFPILLYCFYKKKSLGSLIILLLNVLFLFLTFTRIGYLSVCLQFLIFIMMSSIVDHRQWIRRYVIGIVCIAIAVTVYQIFGHDLYQSLIVNRGDTQSSRFVQFALAFNLLKDHVWFGVGAGQYIPYLQSNLGISDIVVHSQFLNVLVEQGLVSFILYVMLYLFLFVWSLRRFKDELWLPVSLFVGNLTVVNFNPNQYYSICIYTFFIIVLGLLFTRSNASTITSED